MPSIFKGPSDCYSHNIQNRNSKSNDDGRRRKGKDG